jgi:very-short-patch-repair endonuclease
MRWGKLYKGTPAELALEPAVAALGIAYRTQLPGFLYGFRFFPDVFIPQLGLIIEVDDRRHDKADKIAADAERTEQLEAHGWRVVRCTNDEATQDPHGTLSRLLRVAGITPWDIELAKRKPLAGCMPKPGRAPQKARREARSVARRAARTP